MVKSLNEVAQLQTSMAPAEVSDFSGIRNFRPEVTSLDSEAYQEMIRMNLETFYEILTAT